MAAEIRKSTAEISRKVFCGKGQSVCQADVIVPDSMPDCLKVLEVEGTVVQESAVVTKGKISVRGRVECDIIYVPENAHGVRSMSCTMPFAYSENVAEVDEGMYYETDCDVTHMEFQLVNSRKVSIKAVVEAENCVMGKGEINYIGYAEGEGVETKKEKFKASGEDSF